MRAAGRQPLDAQSWRSLLKAHFTSSLLSAFMSRNVEERKSLMNRGAGGGGTAIARIERGWRVADFVAFCNTIARVVL
jgi:hypothetical protein